MSTSLSQFQQAWGSLYKENTSEFNKRYGYISPPSSRPSSPAPNNKNKNKNKNSKTRRRRAVSRKSRKNRRNRKN